MEVSIIIVNYNTLALTKQTIESIREMTIGVDYEIILVDNNSSDGSVEYFKQDEGITFVASPENLGFGRGNNLGVSYANGKYVFLLNSDTILLNNAISLFYNFYEKNSTNLKLGVLGCVLEDLNGIEVLSRVPFKSISNCLKTFSKKFKEKILKHKKIGFNLPSDDVFQVEAVLGADMFLTRELYNKIQGFDEDFFLYGEEVELQKRIHDQGYKNYLIRAPKIIHLEGGSSDNKGKRLSSKTIYRLKEGEFRFIKKHYNPLYYCLYFLVQLITFYPWIIISNRFTKKEKKEFLNLFNI